MYFKCSFLGNGFPGKCKHNFGVNCKWQLNNLDFSLTEKLQRYCKEVWAHVNFKNLDICESSNIYKKSCRTQKTSGKVDENYSKEKKNS